MKLCKEDNFSEDAMKQKLVALERNKPLAKIMFDNTCERWRGILYALHRDDREQLLKMLVDICYSLNEKASKTLIDKVSESSISVLFLFCIVLQNQKMINRTENSTDKKVNNWFHLDWYIDIDISKCVLDRALHFWDLNEVQMTLILQLKSLMPYL